MPSEQDPIGAYVRKAETDFTSGGGTLTSKYVTTDLYEDISKIYAYLESKHISGETDALDRKKPFFNIVIAARNIWYRATDIDRKDIEVTPSKSSNVVAAFIATVLLQDWMKKVNFGAFLNDWGMDSAGFNSVVTKWIETDGKLIPMVVPWSRFICDVVDFKNNPKIEILELTEGQLRQRKSYDKAQVEALCQALAARTTTDGQQSDNKSNYIKLYEVHALWPLSYVTGKKKDEDTFVQQMHVVSYVETDKQGEYDDFTLYSGREAEDPYILTCLLPNSDGSVSLNGAVKTLFQAQWQLNHTVKSVRDQLDVASVLMFQTADETYAHKNVLTGLQQGAILTHKANMPLTQVNNQSHDTSSQEAYGNMWKRLSSEIAGVSESMLGNTAPSGTAWRQVEALLQESHSLFDLMTENKGLCLIEMLTTKVIPHLKKKMDNADEVAAVLEAHNIKKIDAIYVPKAAIIRHNEKVKEALLKGPDELPEPFDAAAMEAEVQTELAPLGNQRFFVPDDLSDKTWKEALEDLEWDLDINVTGESVDREMVFTTLNTALATVANPNYSNNPEAQFIVRKILEQTSVVSPIELGGLTPAPQPVPVPTAAPPVSGGLPVTTQ